MSLLTAAAVAGIACGPSIESPTRDNRDLFVPVRAEDEDRGLVVHDLVCQLDHPTLTATALGRIENEMSFNVVDVTPVVTWSDGDGEEVLVRTGATIPVIQAGDIAIFSVRGPLSDEMESCGIHLEGIGDVRLKGELQADAEMTSELAR